MRIAVLVKQIPAPEQLRMADGRVERTGVDLEVNAYCRRANAKAVELAGPPGEVVVFTMGPPAAEDALREMIACGADRGVHLCDQQMAGSDTLATARALAAAITREEPFDLVLAGLNSLDADTGQVPAELAEMLGLPIAAGVRELEVGEGQFRARLETETGHRTVEGPLPAVLSTAERLISPSKAPPEARAAVDAGLISVVTAADLGLAPATTGAAGSPTSVGPARTMATDRRPRIAATAAEAVEEIAALGAFAGGTEDAEVVAGPTPGDLEIFCSFSDAGSGAELLGEAAQLAAEVGATVVAVVPDEAPPGLGGAGADRVLVLPGATEAEAWADGLARLADEHRPWALLVEGTRTGRVVASIVAARHDWGLTGDAIGLGVADDTECDHPSGRALEAWKPAFGGRLVAPIRSRSDVQMATVRPGVLPRRRPRAAADPSVETLSAPAPARITTISASSDDTDPGILQRATTVVAVGQGVDLDDYPLVDRLRQALGDAALGATRKVTDQGWLPRALQIGVTGHAIAPALVVAVGSSGRFNHTVGLQGAGAILAINSDPEAEIFDQVDVGLVGDHREVIPELIAALDAHRNGGEP